MDIFERIMLNNSPIGELQDKIEGKYVFPKFEGKISNQIYFNDKK